MTTNVDRLLTNNEVAFGNGSGLSRGDRGGNLRIDSTKHQRGDDLHQRMVTDSNNWPSILPDGRRIPRPGE